MKRTVLALAAALCALSLMAQTPKGVKLRFVEGSDLTLVGNPTRRTRTTGLTP